MNSWQATIKAALSRAYKCTGAMWLHERMLCQPFLTILLFHRVTDLIPQDGLTISRPHFRAVCELLRRNFRVVTLAEVFHILRESRPIPPRTVALTFDDCYLDNLSAAQTLHENGFPATFFVPTGYVGTTRTFEWDRGLPFLGNLSWDHLREMVRLGHEVGSHTVTHADLGAVGPEQAWDELVTSRQTIEDQLGRRCRWFAYPFGGRHHLRPEYVPMIERAGYEGAVSAFGGFIRPGLTGGVLPREAVPYFKSLAHLELHLSGCLHWWYDLKGRDRGLQTAPAPPPGHAPADVPNPALTSR